MKKNNKISKKFDFDILENDYIEKNYGLPISNNNHNKKKDTNHKIGNIIDKDTCFSASLINSSVDGIAAMDRNLKIIAWNLSMEYFTTYDASKVMGKKCTNLLFFLRDTKLSENLKKALSGGVATSEEINFKVPESKREGYFEIHYSPFFNSTGKVIGAITIVRDITKHKFAEAELTNIKESLEERVIARTEDLQKMNDALEEEISDHLLSLKRINFNNSILKLLGQKQNRREYLDAVVKLIRDWINCSSVGIRIKNEYNFIPYESYLGFSKEFWQFENWISINDTDCACIRIFKGKLTSPEKMNSTKDGSFSCTDAQEFYNSLSTQEKTKYRGACIKAGYKSISLIPIKYDNQVIGAIHLADRRSEIVSNESVEWLETVAPLIGQGIVKFTIKDELSINNNLLEQFFSATHYLVAQIDSKLNFIRVNPAYANADNHKPEYFIGKNHFELFPNKENEKIFQKVIDTGKPYSANNRSFEYAHSPERGTSFWDWSLYPIKDSKGKVYNLLLILIDVTERRLATQRLLEAYKHVGTVNRQLSILKEINKECDLEDENSLINLITKSAQTLLQAKISGIYLYDENNSTFKLLSSAGAKLPKEKEIKNINFSKKSNKFKSLFEGERIYGDINDSPIAELADLKELIKSYLIIPIIKNKTLKGAFFFGISNKSKITLNDLDISEAFVHEAAHALDNLKIL